MLKINPKHHNNIVLALLSKKVKFLCSFWDALELVQMQYGSQVTEYKIHPLQVFNWEAGFSLGNILKYKKFDFIVTSACFLC